MRYDRVVRFTAILRIADSDEHAKHCQPIGMFYCFLQWTVFGIVVDQMQFSPVPVYITRILLYPILNLCVFIFLPFWSDNMFTATSSVVSSSPMKMSFIKYVLAYKASSAYTWSVAIGKIGRKL